MRCSLMAGCRSKRISPTFKSLGICNWHTAGKSRDPYSTVVRLEYFKYIVELTFIKLFLCNLFLIALVGFSLCLGSKLRTSFRWEDQRIGGGIVYVTSCIHSFLKRIALPAKDIIGMMAITDSGDQIRQDPQISDIGNNAARLTDLPG